MSEVHVHEGLELGICHEGAGVFVVGDRLTPFAAGDVSAIDARIPHIAIAAPGTPARWDWVMLDPEGVVPAHWAADLPPWTEAVQQAGSVFSPQRSPRVNSLVQGLGAELAQTDPHYRDAIRGLLLALLVELHRSTRVDSDTTECDAEAVRRLTRATEMISSRIHESISIEQLAEACDLSPAQMRRLFHAAFGISPQEYITRLRLELARVALRDEQRTVIEVSGGVGYEATSTFNRHFRRLYGESPRQYRQSLKQTT